MLSKLKLFWATILLTVIGFAYVQYVLPVPSEAKSTVSLEDAYDLPSEQVEVWLSTNTEEETIQLVEKHIEEAIRNGAKPVYGEFVLQDYLEQETSVEKSWLEYIFPPFK